MATDLCMHIYSRCPIPLALHRELAVPIFLDAAGDIDGCRPNATDGLMVAEHGAARRLFDRNGDNMSMRILPVTGSV